MTNVPRVLREDPARGVGVRFAGSICVPLLQLLHAVPGGDRALWRDACSAQRLRSSPVGRVARSQVGQRPVY